MTTLTVPKRPEGRVRVWRLAAMIMMAITAVLLLVGLGATPALAATTPTPTPAAACAANATTGCLQGTIKLPSGDPAVGIKLEIKGGDLDTVATTGSDGKWSQAITVAGPYTINLDTSSIPDGAVLDSAAKNPATVNGALNKNVGFVFKIVGGTTADDGTTTQTPTTDAGTGVSFERFLQQLVSGIRLGLLLALAAVGLSLIFGTTGLSNFAHGEQVTLGGLLAYLFANVLGLNLILAAVISVVICAATGYFQDAAIWKPLRRRGLGTTQLMIVTIGLSIALQYAFQYFLGASTVRIDMANPVTVQLGPVALSQQSLVSMGIAIVVIALVGFVLVKTRIGRATRAVSDNPSLAAASGIDVDRIIRLVWTSATALAGLSGVLLGLVLNGVNWQTGLQLLLLMFAAITLGGLGTAFGALAGAMIIGLVVELTNLVLPGDFKYATALVILILVLLVRPQGIFGRRERIG
ncbi:amino acid/amide ABC transporter membrane protein 1 (HAAT family) [Subtercola boreus]|nr:branched-chain amino acid ABC transporter permease [Subtercola boreus]TQL52810.1 amino acid/amide ABC transporter membrane protein 1 (HAAT family) [Subtercola boreus]